LAARKRILVADDDADWRQRIAESLANLRLELAVAASGEDALTYTRREKPDLVVLDLLLPEVSGLGVCRLLREDPALGHTGIVMVTGHATEVDRILAFEVGVDDFLPKPFFGRELASRVGAVLRRSAPARPFAHADAAPLRGRVSVHTASNAVLVGDRRVELTPRELQLLSTLIAQAGRVLTRKQLIAGLWSGESEHTDRVVDAHVKSIRHKLGEARNCVETVRGVGYRFSDVPAAGLDAGAGSANATSASPGSDQPWPPAATTTNWRPSGRRR
jgi:DNA-binding response OmpR family regulator